MAKKPVASAHSHVERVTHLLSRHFILFCSVMVIFAAVVTSLHYLSPSYRTKATLTLQAAINNPLQSLSTRLGGFSGFDVDGREVDRYLTQLRIHAFLERAALDVKESTDLGHFNENDFRATRPLIDGYRRRFSPRPVRAVEEMSNQELIDRLRGMVAFSKDGIDAFSIHVQASSAEVAFRLTNLLARSAVNFLIEYEEKDLKDSEVYLKIQSSKTEESIRDTEAAIARFKKGKKMFSMSSNFDEAAVRSAEIKRELAENQVLIDQNRIEVERLRDAWSALGPEPHDYKFGAQRKISSIRKADEALVSRKATLERELSGLHRTFDENSEQQLMELRKNLDLETSLHQELKKHDFQMEMRRISARNKFRLLEPSRPEVVRPSESLLSKLLVGVIAALLMAGMVAFGVETVNPLASGRAILEEAGLRVLGSVPLGLSSRQKLLKFLRGKRAKNGPLPALMAQKVNSASTHLCARIIDCTEQKNGGQVSLGQVITVTSAEPGEGKTFISERLARGLANCSNRVLLVDGDLRSPALTERKNFFGKEGLCEVIGQRENFGNARIPQISPGLDFLPAGMRRSNPTGLLASREFAALLNDLRAIYDYVVVDTSPLSVSGDAALMAKSADMPVIVVALNETRMRFLHSSIESIWSVGERDIYAVLNKVPPSQHYGYGSYGRIAPPTLVQIKPEERGVAR